MGKPEVMGTDLMHVVKLGRELRGALRDAANSPNRTRC